MEYFISSIIAGLISFIAIKIHLSFLDKWMKSFFEEEDKRIKDYLIQISQK